MNAITEDELTPQPVASPWITTDAPPLGSGMVMVWNKNRQKGYEVEVYMYTTSIGFRASDLFWMPLPPAPQTLE